MLKTLITQEMMIWGPLVKAKVKKVFTDEKGDVNIVSIVVLMGIAVLLALVFQKEVTKLLEGLFGTISEKANDAVGGNAGGGE